MFEIFEIFEIYAMPVFEICKWTLEALSDSPRLNHQINIPSKGSMVWGELSVAAL